MAAYRILAHCALLATALLAPSVRAAEPADLLITHGYVVTMDDRYTVHDPGVVAVRAGRIVAIGGPEVATRFAARETLDAQGAIVMPGFINTHTHVSMTVFRGLGDDVPDRLRRLIFPLEKALVDRELVYWGGLHGMIEMAEGGVTTFADMYYFEDEVARGARQLGLRAVLGQTIVDFPAPDAPEPYGGITYGQRFLRDFADDPLITPALAPHSPYTLDETHLRAIARLSADTGAPVLMHVAEMPDEIAMLRRTRNQTPVEYLDTVGLLNRRLVAAHGIFLTDSDIALLHDRDVGVAHNLVANIKSAKGVAPILALLRANVRVGLGTDGPMSGNTIDIIGQLGYVAKVHKLDRKDRNVMPAIDVVTMATRGGARTLHLEDRIGSLEAGKRADIVLIDRTSTAMQPFYDVYSALVYAASPRDVRTTLVEGRFVLRDRRVTGVDAMEVQRHVRGLAEKITARVARGL